MEHTHEPGFLWNHRIVAEYRYMSRRTSPDSEQQGYRKNFGSDPLTYYRKHYEGLTRGELRRRDSSLYQRLWWEGLLEQVPEKNRVIDNALAYYREHYEGLTRGELKKRDQVLYR